MNSARHRHLTRHFARLSALRPEDRWVHLARVVEADPELEEDLAELLACHDEGAGVEPSPLPFLARELLEAVGSTTWPPPRFTPGMKVGAFEIRGFIARGGAGEIYRARRDGGEEVALKVMATAGLSKRAIARFKAEVDLTRSVRHPHLVEVFEDGEDSEHDVLYYSMRLHRGPTLETVLRDSAGASGAGLDRELIVQRVSEVASALAALHSRGVVHGDVKPGNVVLEQHPRTPLRGKAVLVDLGLAHRGVSTLGTVTWQATPTYAAPEVLRGARPSSQSDVFSLGLTLHDLLAGKPPEARSWWLVNSRLKHLRVSGVSRELNRVLRTSTAVNPARRYRSALEVAADLNSDPPGVARIARRRERRRTLLRVVVAAALLALITVAFAAHRHRHWTAAQAAWERGDLSSASHELQSAPGWSQDFAPRQVVELALAIREAQDPRLAEVLDLWETTGREAGLIGAARLLRRDGFASSSLLVALLERNLEAPWLEPDIRFASSAELLATLFLQRSVETPSEWRASAAIRRRLEGLVDTPGVGLQADDRLFAVSALSGCGDADSLVLLLKRACDGAPGFTGEFPSLATRASTAIIRRFHRLGDPAQLPLERVSVAVGRALALRDNASIAEEDVSNLLRSLVYSTRALHGEWPATFGELHRDGEDIVRASLQDASLVEELRSWHPGPAGLLRQCEKYGRLVGSYDDRSLRGSCEQRVELTCPESELAAGIRQFRRGLQVADGEQAGVFDASVECVGFAPEGLADPEEVPLDFRFIKRDPSVSTLLDLALDDQPARAYRPSPGASRPRRWTDTTSRARSQSRACASSAAACPV